ncbi:MAG: T9SS type A sorting domain-containing protein [Candidatus Eisenbacteria bacterium]|uniref:T9SS type A sorting domain-containing protein n=1 Tax=Eiseniibacteriota bacterium TaxID=2212470 RepID=A0A849SJK5_UNCEI|nr:T9SS type A sorting domain-containing protein [Candidatus Eisenbacteria bacterium]
MIALATTLSIVPRAARADDAAPDFSPIGNSVTNRWSYGFASVPGGAFSLLPNAVTDGFGRKGWVSPANGAAVYRNVNGFAVNLGSGLIVPHGALTLEAGPTGAFTVLRWRAPRSGTATVSARFIRLAPNEQEPTQVGIYFNGTKVYSRWLTRDVSPVASVAASLTVNLTDAVEFVVGDGDGNNARDIIQVDATVNMEPNVLPTGPVITFAGQRFVACSGDTAFESMAFDPVNRRLVSNEILRDLCGTALSPGPTDAPGLTWDLRTQTYWQVTSTRVVRQWSAAGVLIGDLFTIPQIFTVPGWGPDTLDSVRGIAVDSNFVYVVDSGPAGSEGEIYANEWFKFTRTGTPVKSSKLTNFHANLDLNPDAVADDIVYVPFSNPFLKGKLIIALEHSGMQVIDTDGNFVSKFRWTDPGVPADIKIFGFAGLSIDPLTGNLYLVENAGARTQLWTRIPTTSATYYAIGTGGGPPRLQLPATGCNRPLWESMPSDASFVFGCTYRGANQSVYGLDFGSSQLYRFHALSGIGGRATITGAFNSWACAYDTERDVLYGAIEISGTQARLVAIDPNSGAVDPRPSRVGFGVTDLAFNSTDKNLYGASGVQLIRIDRDTGVGTLVGPTPAVTGIDFDPGTNRLIGIQNSGPAGSATMWSINPATGAGTTITTVPKNIAWEGLAVVPLPAQGAVAVESEATPPPSPFLSAAPNPSRGPVTLQFALPRDANVSAGVFDVEGRRIRAIETGRRAAGRNSLSWDGRDDNGRSVTSGVYFARVEYGSQTLISRIVRIE